jgi:hypothetical protein
VFRYVNFLVNQKRTADAIAVAEVASAGHPDKSVGDQFRYLLKNLRDIRSQQAKSPSAN